MSLNNYIFEYAVACNNDKAKDLCDQNVWYNYMKLSKDISLKTDYTEHIFSYQIIFLNVLWNMC